MIVTRVLLATRDEVLERSIASDLARRGFVVDVARTNLELVFRLTRWPPKHTGLVLDARPSSFGAEPLAWLREDRSLPCSVVVLARDDDLRAREAAELAGAAGVVDPAAPPGVVADEVKRALRGRSPGDALRWILPRSPAGSRRARRNFALPA